MSDLKKTAILLLGHGSSKHPDSSSSVRLHAKILHERGGFDEVHVAFLKEEPLVENALGLIESEEIWIVPDFLAEGYFTRQIIPEMLELDSQPETVHYGDPVGTHPMMAELIDQSAHDILGDWDPSQVSLLLVGHGSTRNSQSKQTLLDHIIELEKTTPFAQVSDLWLEESPFVREWVSVATQKKIIVVPFLLSDGQHGGWDIPEMLGLSRDVSTHDVTHEVKGRELKISPALGTSPRFVEVIERIACLG